MSSQVLERSLSGEDVKEELVRVRRRLELADYLPEFIKRVLRTARPLIEHPEGLESYEIWDCRHLLIPPLNIPILRDYVNEFKRELEVLCQNGLARYEKRKGVYFFNYQQTHKPIQTAA